MRVCTLEAKKDAALKERRYNVRGKG